MQSQVAAYFLGSSDGKNLYDICSSLDCLHGGGGTTAGWLGNWELGTGHLSSLALLRCTQANQLSRYSGAVVSLLIQIWWLPIKRIVLNLQRNTACRVGPLVLWKVTRNRFLLAATCCHSAGKPTMNTDLDVCILQILSSHSTSSAMQKLPARLCGAIIRPWYWNVWDRIIPPILVANLLIVVWKVPGAIGISLIHTVTQISSSFSIQIDVKRSISV